MLSNEQFLYLSRDRLGWRQWKSKPEGGALTRGTIQPNHAAMTLDDSLADVQAEPQPQRRAAAHLDARYPVEDIPDMGQILRRNAFAVVSYLHARPSGGEQYAHDNWLVDFGILQRVGQI